MLLINEWRLYCRQPVVWLCLLGLPGLSVLLTQGLSVDDAQLAKRLTLVNITVLMMTLPIVIGALTPAILMREQLCQMQELTAATPTNECKRRYYQLMGVLSLVILLCIVSGSLQLLVLSFYGSFDATLLLTGLKNALVLTLPACVLYCSLALYAAQSAKSPLTIYALFALCWVGYVMLASITGSPVLAGSSILNPTLYQAMLLFDPLGFTAVFDQYQSGAPQWAMSMGILTNRLIWLFISAFVIHRVLSAPPQTLFSTPSSTGLLKVFSLLSAALTQVHQLAFSDKVLSNTLIPDIVQQWRYSPFGALFSGMCSIVIHNRIFVFIILFYGGVVFSEVLAGIDYAEFSAVITPLSSDALNRVTWDILPFAGCVLMALWSWQLGWENQRHRVAELIAAAPVTNVQLILAQAATLFVAWCILLVTTALATATSQLLSSSAIEAGTYWLVLLMGGAPVLLFGWFCLALHHLFRHSLTAGVVGLLLLIVKFTPVLNLAGISHPLLDIAGTPLQPLDALIGFSRSASTFAPYALVWVILTLSALRLAIIMSHRGTGLSLVKWRHLPVAGFLIAGLVVCTVSAFHLLLKSEKPQMSADARYALRADYEKQFAHWDAVPQPIVTHIDAKVDFYPEARQASLSLDMQLTNVTTSPITEILIGSFPGFTPQSLTLDGANLSFQDTQLHQYVFTLAAPLMPKDSITLDASILVDGARMWLPAGHQVLLPEFGYLRAIPMLPYVGFNRQYTLRDEQTRLQFGLPELNMAQPSTFATHPPATKPSSRPITLHSKVSAPLSHSVVAQGTKVHEWQQDGRRYVEFKTVTPIRNIPVWLTSIQTPLSSVIKLSTHSVNVHYIGLGDTLTGAPSSDAHAIHELAVSDTLQWFSNTLIPYPYSDLSLVFVPEIGPSGYALPQVILMSHRLAVRARPADDAGFDQRYRRTVHEVAHQWFGHSLGYGVEEDGSFLIESLAKYTELVLIEQRFGKSAMQALVEYEKTRYQYSLRGRLTSQQAIIDATHSADVYSRATIVFAELRERLGDKVIVDTLNELFAKNQPGFHSVTSLDFVHALLARTPNEHQNAVRDLLLSGETDL